MLEKCDMTTQEIPSNILRSERAYGLKIAKSIIYVKGYFYMIFSTLKDIIQAQIKKNHCIS